MLPSAAGYSITSNHPLSYYNQSSSDANFEVTTEGTLDANQIGSESDPVSNIHTKTISTDSVSSKEEPVFNVEAWGAVGDGTTDDTQAIQDAIDAASAAGGEVYFPIPDDYYRLETSGNEVVCELAENYGGIEYALEHKSDVTLRGRDRDKTILKTPNEEVVPIWCNDQSNVSIDSLFIDGNYHTTPQPSDWNPNGSIQGIMFGGTNKPSTGSTDITLKNLRISGAIRHGIDTQYCKRVWADTILFDDASGDDDISISTNTESAIVSNCISINKQRDGDWGPGCFEAEDGAQHVAFVNCYAVAPAANSTAFVLGKFHGNGQQTAHHYAVNCHAIAPEGAGFTVGNVRDNSQTVRDIYIDDFSVIGAGGAALHANVADSGLEDVTILNGHIEDCGTGMETDETNPIENFRMKDITVRGLGSVQSVQFPFGSEYRDLTLDGVTVKDGDVQAFAIGASDVTVADVDVIGNRERGMGITGDHLTFDGLTVRNNGQGTNGVGVDVNGASDFKFTNCDIYDDQGTKTQTKPLTIQSGSEDGRVSQCVLGPSANGEVVNKGTDVRFRDNVLHDPLPLYFDPTREVRDGWGTNAGDPSSTGQWNGNGYEGLMVRDTTNGNNYSYINGGWVAL